MTFANIFTVYAKELRDVLRDRRTLLSMIVVPTLLIPGLTLATGVIASKAIRQAQSSAATIMIVGAEQSPAVAKALEGNAKLQIVPVTPDWKQRISDKKIRAAVELPADFDAALAAGRAVTVTLYNYDGEMRSTFALNELRRFFSEYRDREVAGRLQARGLPPAMIKPFEVTNRNVAPPEKVGGNAFGGIIPYFFLVLAFTGAMYPALDLTAGEKERGTMETLLCSPVRRTELVLGKFLMVLTASLCTVAFSALSSVLSLMVAGSLLAPRAAGMAKAGAAAGGALPSIDPLGLVGVVVMVIPMAVLFAAVQFTLALFAKNFKEAQSYVSPLIVVILLPAMIGMMPGIELNARLALVPILNLALVSKELVSGVWHWHYIALIFVSTCAYATVALGIAVRMFSREDVMFRS